MATEIKSSFDDLSEPAFKAYAVGLVDAQDSADKRQRAISYLAQVGAQDKAAQDLAGSVLNQKRFLRQKQATIVETLMVNHAFDFSKSAPMFAAPAARTDAQILALAAQDDADIFLRDRTITGDLVVTGDRVKISGLGASGTALGDGITHTVQINGQITIGADDLILEGIKFVCSLEKSIKFTAASANLTLRRCTFENTFVGTANDLQGAAWIHGEGEHLSGTVLIEDCLVKDYASWMLADPTTSSSVDPAVRLEDFTLTKCKFVNCAGSIAVRGNQANPNGIVRFTDNLVEYGALGVHASFWNCFEANNFAKCICTGNTCTTMIQSGTRGFMQAWSKSAVPWTLIFEKNTLAHFHSALQCALNASFYLPNVHDDEYKLGSEAGKYTDVTYGASYVYPWDGAGPVAPENGSGVPASSFADALGVYSG